MNFLKATLSSFIPVSLRLSLIRLLRKVAAGNPSSIFEPNWFMYRFKSWRFAKVGEDISDLITLGSRPPILLRYRCVRLESWGMFVSFLKALSPSP